MAPKTLKRSVSKEMKASMSASQVTSAIRDYYRGVVKVNPVVTKTYYDKADKKIVEICTGTKCNGYRGK
jgi:hypothetical protein